MIEGWIRVILHGECYYHYLKVQKIANGSKEFIDLMIFSSDFKGTNLQKMTCGNIDSDATVFEQTCIISVHYAMRCLEFI